MGERWVGRLGSMIRSIGFISSGIDECWGHSKPVLVTVPVPVRVPVSGVECNGCKEDDGGVIPGPRVMTGDLPDR